MSPGMGFAIIRGMSEDQDGEVVEILFRAE